MKKANQKMIFGAIFIIAMLTSTVGIGSVFATGVGNASQSSFTYTKGTYSSYTDVAILYSPANGQQTGFVKAYDDGTYLHIWVWAFAKPYLGWGEKVATTPSLGVAGMGSDGIWINLNGVIPAAGSGLYNWKVDAGAEKDPEIHSPSYDISAAIGGAAGALAPGRILNGPDVYVATLPMGSQTVFNVALFEHNSPPKEPLPNPSEIITQLFSADNDLPTAGPVNVGDSVYDTATVTSTSISTSNPVTYVGAGGGAHSTSLSMNVAYPKAHTGDLIILQVMVRDTTTSLTTPNGFTILYGPDSSGSARQWILYKFATTNPTGSIALSFTGSNTVLKEARVYAFRNVATSSFTESPAFGTNAASNSILAQSVTTSGVGRLAVSFAFDSVDKGLPAFTGESGGDWKEPTGEFHCPDGGKGTIQLQAAAMASTGTISGGSANIGATTAWGVRAFALKPTGSAIIYPTGTVDFQVLAPGGIWTTYDSAVPLISGLATSKDYQVSTIGTYYFRAIYSGDATDLPSQSDDNDEPLTVTSQSKTVTIPTVPVTATVTNVIPWDYPFIVQLSNVPSGYTVTNSPPNYIGWCVDLQGFINRGASLTVTLSSSLNPPSAYASIQWDMINYIINNKQGSGQDIQQAIWYFANGGSWPTAILQNDGYPYGPVPSTLAQAMVNDALANGAGFTPSSGQWMAVICTNPGGQNFIIEVDP